MLKLLLLLRSVIGSTRHSGCFGLGSSPDGGIHFWKGGRAVDCAGLENRLALAGYVGSNPTLSALMVG